jgi:hypothetical protein
MTPDRGAAGHSAATLSVTGHGHGAPGKPAGQRPSAGTLAATFPILTRITGPEVARND